MTQTNDSELENAIRKIVKEIDVGSSVWLETALTKAFAAGEKSGIAKAEKCVPEEKLLATVSETSQPLSYTAWNSCRNQMLNNLAKLKNL